ncbi:unnamed protein product [Durusdinium trenchii]|uniref:Uncharacterized protein n=2 Tax=Durusdinium trenchii TaxID=1381693 RepID=A0ABP0PEZ6_9DINO
MAQMLVLAVVAWLLKDCLADKSGCGSGPFFMRPPFNEKHSTDVCKTCITSAGNCQWCPFSQSCGHKRSWGRSASCMNDGEYKPVDAGNGCGQTPPWMEILDKNYGASLDSTNSDIMRCLQDRVERWKVDKAPQLPETWDDEKISDFSCLSALLREAVTSSLGSSQSKTKFSALIMNSSMTSLTRAPIRALGDNWGEREPEMTFCSLFEQFFPKETCKAWVYGESDFAQLRLNKASPGRAGPTDLSSELRSSFQGGHLRPSPLGLFDEDKLKGILTTHDQKYMIHVDFNELKNLKTLITGKEGAISLRDHLEGNSYSLVQRIYGLVYIKILGVKAYCLVMSNEGYGLGLKTASSNVARYDLKGKSRSQSKKSKNPLIGKNGDFAEREANQLPMKNWQCKSLRKKIAPDIAWLQSHGMGDYSLYAEIASGGQNPVGCSGLPGVPLCNVREEKTTTLSIIDFMQDRRSSSAEKFGSQMLELVDTICHIDKQESMESWQIYLIVACFATLLLCGSLLGWKYGGAFLRSDRPHELRDVEMTGLATSGVPSGHGGPWAP